MEDQKSKYTNEQAQIYLQEFKIKDRFSTIEDKKSQDVLNAVREMYMENRYTRHRILLQKIFEDYHLQRSHVMNPSILVIGPGHGYEVRVLRDFNKNIELIVEPDTEGLKVAKFIGNIVDEKTYEGFIQNVPSEWNGKFDIAIWQGFVSSDFKDTLKSIHTLLKPNCIFYPESDARMLAHIHFDEEIHNLYDEQSLFPIDFDAIHLGKMTGDYSGISRLTKK